MLDQVKLEVICPECEHFFKAEVDTIINCPNCDALLSIESFEDEWAGELGIAINQTEK